MNTSDGPIWSKCSIALTCPTRSHFQRTQSKERWDQGWHERYCSSREGEERGDEERQATDFKEAVCCPFCGRSGGSIAKNEGECPGYLGPLGRPTAILTQPKWGRGPHHHVEAAVDWCRGIEIVCSASQAGSYQAFV